MKEVLISFTIFVFCISLTLFSQFNSPQIVNAAEQKTKIVNETTNIKKTNVSNKTTTKNRPGKMLKFVFLGGAVFERFLAFWNVFDAISRTSRCQAVQPGKGYSTFGAFLAENVAQRGNSWDPPESKNGSKILLLSIDGHFGPRKIVSGRRF